MIFDAVKKINLVEQITTQIKKSILKGFYKPGDKLPPERELAKTLNVTRTTLREAIKKLEGINLIIVKQGEGVLVQDYLKSASLDIIKDLLYSDDKVVSEILQNILEARKIFALQIVNLALKRKTDEEIKEYAEIIEKMEKNKGDFEKLQELDFQCFDLFARMSKNIVFILIINSIREIYFENRKIFLNFYHDSEKLLKMHKALFQAMKGKGKNEAFSLLEEYLQYWEKILENEVKNV